MRTLIASAVLLLSWIASSTGQSPSPAPSSPNSGITLSSSAGAYSLSWWGIAGNTYFIKESLDLQTWTYIPIIESGFGEVTSWGLSSNAASLFFKLEYTAIPAYNPYSTDFIGSGLTAWQLIQNNIDPLSTSDTGGLGILDAWRLYYFGTVNINPNAPAARGDGLTILQAFQQGENPNDFYNGQLPSLSFVNGAGQRGQAGAFLPQPLAVAVNSGQYNAPLTLTVSSGHALLASSTSSTPSASLQVRSISQATGGNAATVYVFLPTTVGDASTILATAASGGSSVSINTTVAVVDSTLQPPQNFTAVPTSPTTAQLSWTPSNSALPTTVQESTDNGLDWKTVEVVPGGSNTTTLTGLSSEQTVQLRLYTGSDTPANNCQDEHDNVRALSALKLVTDSITISNPRK